MNANDASLTDFESRWWPRQMTNWTTGLEDSIAICRASREETRDRPDTDDTFPRRRGLSFDWASNKLTDVYNTGTRHEEKQPCHLKVDTCQCQRGRRPAIQRVMRDAVKPRLCERIFGWARVGLRGLDHTQP